MIEIDGAELACGGHSSLGAHSNNTKRIVAGRAEAPVLIPNERDWSLSEVLDGSGERATL